MPFSSVHVNHPLTGDTNLYLNNELVVDLIIPEEITSIRNFALSKCKSLRSVTIHDKVTEIGDRAFYYCNNITSVVIGKRVSAIGGCAFEGCLSLKEVYSKSTTPPVGGSNMFSYFVDGESFAIGCKIYVPTASVEAYKSASYWSDYASDIEGYDF